MIDRREASESPVPHYRPGEVVSVLVATPVDRRLDYRMTADGGSDGSFVRVPLGPRTVLGVVWGRGECQLDPARIRDIDRVLDVPPMQADMKRFLTRAADYTLTSLNAMLVLSMRVQGLGDPPGVQSVYGAGEGRPDRMTPARERALTFLGGQRDARFPLSELAEKSGVSPAVIKGLVKWGAVTVSERRRDARYPTLDPARPGPDLSPDQRQAADAFRERIRSGGHRTCLLNGVTGSGKTAVYLEAVAECLEKGRQALVLLPEIALTGEFLDQVHQRFGAVPACWHSAITGAERRRCWRMAAEGGAQLVVGARSALFLPFRNLGLIVVDEEHDSSYKQEDGILYNARDMAVLRASVCRSLAILASATPSLESWSNWKSGKYTGFRLPERYGHAALPELRAIDLRQETLDRETWISPTLAKEIETGWVRGEQSLLFLNRRGYAPVTVCRNCGHQLGCDHCDARLVLHRFRGKLVCHQCGESRLEPTVCARCGASGKLNAIGPGVERLAEEAKERFPEQRISVLSSDVALSAQAMRERIRQIAEGGVDIIIGTQMVAKGHHFPLLSTVGVIDADLGLQGGDLRAAERTYQLIHQVSGRAGREGRPGVSLIQTHQPEHPVIQSILSGDGEAFRRSEAAQRKSAGVPPYGRLAAVILTGTDLAAVNAAAQGLAGNAEILRRQQIVLYGPAPAPVARVRGRHRVRLLARAPRSVVMQPPLRAWRDSVRLPASVRMQIDIDPQSFH